MAEAAIAITNKLPVPPSPKRMAILAAAEKLFVGNGFGATSMDAIAAEANVSKRTVYSHFENKEALFAAIMEDACARQGGQEGCPLNCDGSIGDFPVDDMMRRTAVHLLTIICAGETTELFRVVMGEAGRFPELGRTFYDNGPGWIISALADYLSAADAAGLISITDPLLASRQFIGLVIDPIKLELTLGVRREPDAAEIETLASQSTAAFMKING